LTPGSGIGKKSGYGSGMNNPDHIYESLETIFGVKVQKFFDADPGWKKFGSGMEKIRIRDKHPGSAILLLSLTMSMMNFLRVSYKDGFEKRKKGISRFPMN
jgi:hypothetical protein